MIIKQRLQSYYIYIYIYHLYNDKSIRFVLNVFNQNGEIVLPMHVNPVILILRWDHDGNANYFCSGLITTENPSGDDTFQFVVAVFGQNGLENVSGEMDSNIASKGQNSHTHTMKHFWNISTLLHIFQSLGCWQCVKWFQKV